MENTYHFRLRARRALPLPSGRFLRRLLVFSLCALLTFTLIFNFQLYPGISALATAQAENQAQSVIGRAFAAGVEENPALYDNLITFTYKTDGSIAALRCDVPALNRARNALLLSVIDSLTAESATVVRIPLGNLLGGEMLSGRGPDFCVRVLLAQGSSAHMESQFVENGINQTLHRVLFSVTVRLTVLTPSHQTETTVKQTFCVAETVILGTVPESYTKINRLTDDVTEDEIDDRMDFGNQE